MRNAVANLIYRAGPRRLASAQTRATRPAFRLAGILNPLVVGQVEVNPTSDGFPGGAMAQKLLNWAGQLGLWGSLLSILVGACIWGVSQQFGNGFQTGKGKVLVGAGAIGAVITGLGAIIVNTLFNAARG